MAEAPASPRVPPSSTLPSHSNRVGSVDTGGVPRPGASTAPLTARSVTPGPAAPGGSTSRAPRAVRGDAERILSGNTRARVYRLQGIARGCRTGSGSSSPPWSCTWRCPTPISSTRKARGLPPALDQPQSVSAALELRDTGGRGSGGSSARPRPALTAEDSQRTRNGNGCPRCLRAVTTGTEALAGESDLPAPERQHALAAAIQGHANVIATRDLQDAYAGILRSRCLTPRHPDGPVAGLSHTRGDLSGALRATRGRSGTPACRRPCGDAGTASHALKPVPAPQPGPVRDSAQRPGHTSRCSGTQTTPASARTWGIHGGSFAPGSPGRLLSLASAGRNPGQPEKNP